MPKETKIVKATAESLLPADPLSYRVKRGKVARKHVEGIVPTRGRSAFGHLTQNWVGAGMLTHTLRAIYTSEETLYVEQRELLKEKGFVKRPQELDFDILALIEAAFPVLSTTEDLARRLNRTPSEITARLDYLRHFVALMCGVNVLRNGKGSVGIADAKLWADWQNRMALMQNGLRESQERHGLNLQNVVKQKLIVKEELQTIQPMIFGLDDDNAAGAVAAHD